MSLVKIEEYTGDLIQQTVIEALEMVGVINKLNINGYHIAITPVHSNTPKGMIDDTACKHQIVIDRNKYISTMTDKEFRKLMKNDNDTKKIYDELNKSDMDFIESENRKITKEITHDSSGYTWYKHKIEFELSRQILETEKSYIERLFETIANYVIEAFENTKAIAEGGN